MCSRTCFEMRDKTQPGMNVSPSSCITGGQNYICNQKRWITLSFHLNYYTRLLMVFQHFRLLSTEMATEWVEIS